MLTFENPRKSGREAIVASVAPDVWKQNKRLQESLIDSIHAHRIASHPIINAMANGAYNHLAMQVFHLEFRHAFAQIFTDALIQAMFTAAQLEPRLGAVGKVAARFLLQLNLLDELGFRPNATTSSDYAGNPYASHYVQFDETLTQLKLDRSAVNGYEPSAVARRCRATFEDTYTDHASLTCILAVSETVFTRYCGAWAQNVGRASGIDINTGYHSIHTEHDGQFIDDDHAEDAWYVFMQAATPERHDELKKRAIESLDTWVDFLDVMASSATQTRIPGISKVSGASAALT